jgi:hypothetical protein
VIRSGAFFLFRKRENIEIEATSRMKIICFQGIKKLEKCRKFAFSHSEKLCP